MGGRVGDEDQDRKRVLPPLEGLRRLEKRRQVRFRRVQTAVRIDVVKRSLPKSVRRCKLLSEPKRVISKPAVRVLRIVPEVGQAEARLRTEDTARANALLNVSSSPLGHTDDVTHAGG